MNYWLRQFGGESAFTELLANETGSVRPVPDKAAERQEKPAEGQSPADNPFPPGYGEDLLENEE